MTKALTARKKEFRAARALAGMTARQFADAAGVTVTHINEVLAGNRVSPRIDAEIEAFIAKHLHSQKAAVGAGQ